MKVCCTFSVAPGLSNSPSCCSQHCLHPSLPKIIFVLCGPPVRRLRQAADSVILRVQPAAGPSEHQPGACKPQRYHGFTGDALSGITIYHRILGHFLHFLCHFILCCRRFGQFVSMAAIGLQRASYAPGPSVALEFSQTLKPRHVCRIVAKLGLFCLAKDVCADSSFGTVAFKAFYFRFASASRVWL